MPEANITFTIIHPPNKQKDRLAAVSPKLISNFDQTESLAFYAARGTSFFIIVLASISA